jgi:CheY-like chemotaxis protein
MKAGDCVLYVEDDADHAELVLRSLERRGKRDDVVHVEDGASALDYLSRSERSEVRRPKLILLDLKLPRADGFVVLRAVRSSPELAATPVVVLTTSASQHDLRLAYAHHVNSYLLKPTDFATLEALVAEVDDYWLVLNQQPLVDE